MQSTEARVEEAREQKIHGNRGAFSTVPRSLLWLSSEWLVIRRRKKVGQQRRHSCYRFHWKRYLASRIERTPPHFPWWYILETSNIVPRYGGSGTIRPFADKCNCNCTSSRCCDLTCYNVLLQLPRISHRLAIRRPPQYPQSIHVR